VTNTRISTEKSFPGAKKRNPKAMKSRRYESVGECEVLLEGSLVVALSILVEVHGKAPV
jgi:hypothetical protein